MSSSEWRKVKLRDVAQFQKGFAFKSKDFIENGVKVVKVSNLTNESIDFISCVSIKEEIAIKCLKYEIMPNDIIITTVGSWPTNPSSVVGKVIKTPKIMIKSLLNQNAVRIRATDDTMQKYLYYCLRDFKFSEYIVGTAQGSANQASITQQDIKNYNIYLPPLPEQKAIAHILSTLDEKIEVNNQINKTLENIAQTIFKQWFVDFEFPNGAKEPYKSSGGEMVESELGMIPKGWEVKTLNDISKDIITGKTPSKNNPDNFAKDIPFVKIPDMHGKTFILETNEYLSNKGVNKSKLIPKNGLMISCIATPGLVSIASENCQTNQQINSIILDDENMIYFAYFKLNELAEYIKTLGSTGSATLNLNKGEFSKIKIVVPNKELLDKFFILVDKLFKLILFNMKSNINLKELRDSLLPKLMSGEIRVPIEEN